MGTVTIGRVIEAPVDVVWHTLNDITHTPNWVVGLEKAEIKTQPPFGMGTIYFDYNRLGPMPQITPWYIDAFEPQRRQVHVSESTSIPSRLTISLDAAGANTWLEFTMEFRFLPQLGVVGRVLERVVMRRMVTQVITQNLANLDGYLKRTARASLVAMRGM